MSLLATYLGFFPLGLFKVLGSQKVATGHYHLLTQVLLGHLMFSPSPHHRVFRSSASLDIEF